MVVSSNPTQVNRVVNAWVLDVDIPIIFQYVIYYIYLYTYSSIE